MAVFPDRIILKNSRDARQSIQNAIRVGGTSEIVSGELILANYDDYASLYTVDASGRPIAVTSARDTFIGELSDVTTGRAWYTDFESGNITPTLGSDTVSTDVAYNGTQCLKSTTTAFASAVPDAFRSRRSRYDYWSFWFRTASTISTTLRVPLGGTRSAGVTAATGVTGYALYVNGTDLVFAGEATQNLAVGTITGLTADTWHHFLVQMDWGSTVNRNNKPTVSVWVNGTRKVNSVLVTAAFTNNEGRNLLFNSNNSTAFTKYLDKFQCGQGLTTEIASGSTIVPADIDAAIRATGPALNSALVFNGGAWVPGTAVGGGSSSVIVATTPPTQRPDASPLEEGDQWWDSDDELLYVYVGSTWILASTGGPAASYDVAMDGGDFDTGLTDNTNTIFDNFPISIDAHSDVDTTTTPPANGQVLSWNGTNWIPGAAPASNLDALTDVVITTPSSAQTLRYNGTSWVNSALGWADITGKPTFATVATSGAYADLTGKPTIPTAINDLSDVDTATTAPSANQVLAWNGTNWVPADQSGGGGGGGSVSGTIIRKTESRTAASSAATFTGIGASGLLVSFHSDIDAWVVLYPSAADRTADAGRAYGVDPTPGSGVLAEVFVAAGTTVLASPGTAYFNNDTTSSDAIYAAIRDQAGAAANATVTIVAYAHQTFAGIGTNRVSDSGTAAAGALDLTGLGQTGQLCTITSSLDAWIVIYGSDTDRTADAGRGFSVDPATGSGVMAEFYVTAGTTILATPGTGYFNNDTTPTDAIYLAVRNQAGAAVNSLVTITAYAETSYSAISGGTFGSG